GGSCSSDLSSQAADSEGSRAVGGRAAGVVVLPGGALFGGLPILDDVTVPEQDPAGDLAPLRLPPQQELQLHGEVLVLLAQRVGHDRQRVGVLLHRDRKSVV